jgi:hypothetical protein
MNNKNETSTEDQVASFQKVWLETVTKMMQVAFTVTPDSLPPEAFRHMRAGVFRTLAESWDEFLRSPQFLEAMKQSMEQTVTLRKMSNEFLGKLRHEMQAPSRDDIDTVMLTVRHMEKRLLDRMEELSSQVSELKECLGTARQRRGRVKSTSMSASTAGARPK